MQRSPFLAANASSALNTDELLRAEWVARLSALDLFVHELVSQRMVAIHRHLFQDIYEWAGHTRDERIRMSDGSIATKPIMRKPEGAEFVVGPKIPQALDQLTSTATPAKQGELPYGNQLPEFSSKILSF